MLIRDGALNGMLESVGLESLTSSWLLRPPLNTWAMIVASTWQSVGVRVLLFLIGLQVIPKEPIEARGWTAPRGGASSGALPSRCYGR